MELHEVIGALEGRGAAAGLRVVGDQGVEVGVAVHDSRAVEPGCLYCCIPGARHDGHDFAAAAVADGAAALLVDHELDLAVPQVIAPSVRRTLGPVAAVLAGDPSEHLEVVGVTGTNGKTTTTHLLAAILTAAGRSCATIGTLTGARTTPEAPELQAQLATMVAEGRDAVAMEVSSHALDQHRVDGTRFRVGVFTNLSQDHLDHHETMEAYFAAKARLFTPDLCDVAVVNRDDPRGRLLAEVAAVPTRTYGLDDAADLELGAAGSTFTWRGATVRLPLPGRFNVANALAAATAAAELGIDAATVAEGLAAAGVVAGRFERVEVGQPFLAVVDYAHTPEGLAELLGAARELASGRVIVVFGAGGDRDPSKRPLMGEAAAAGADLVVLTTDNPRSEDPAAIISAVRAGIDDETDLLVEPDRAAAIAAAAGAAGPDDAVVVAGKGHETTQVVGDRSTPFDDRLVLADALAAAGWSATSEVGR